MVVELDGGSVSEGLDWVLEEDSFLVNIYEIVICGMKVIIVLLKW